MSVDFFSILEISENASDEEIRKAYARKVRQYPPEKDPENFRKIREAYEVLINPETRKQYIQISRNESLIKSLEEKGLKSMQAQDYKTAESCFRQILSIAPSVDYIRNLLGMVYFHQGRYNEALREFKLLVIEHPKNSLYLSNLGVTYKMLKNYAEAEQYLKKAIESDPTEVSSYLALSDVYIEQNNFVNAINILEKAIQADGKFDFNDIMFLLKQLEVYILKKDILGAKKTFSRIKEVTPNDPESKNFVTWKIGIIAAILFDVKAFELAEEIANWTLEFSNIPELVQLRDSAREGKLVLKEYEAMNNDYKISQIHKAFIGAVILKVIYNQENENFENVFNAFGMTNIEKVIREVEYIKNNYKNIYFFIDKYLNSFYTGLLKTSTTSSYNTASYPSYSSYSSSSSENSYSHSSNSNSYSSSASYSSGTGCLLGVIVGVIIFLIFIF